MFAWPLQRLFFAEVTKLKLTPFRTLISSFNYELLIWATMQFNVFIWFWDLKDSLRSAQFLVVYMSKFAYNCAVPQSILFQAYFRLICSVLKWIPLLVTRWVHCVPYKYTGCTLCERRVPHVYTEKNYYFWNTLLCWKCHRMEKMSFIYVWKALTQQMLKGESSNLSMLSYVSLNHINSHYDFHFSKDLLFFLF